MSGKILVVMSVGYCGFGIWVVRFPDGGWGQWKTPPVPCGHGGVGGRAVMQLPMHGSQMRVGYVLSKNTVLPQVVGWYFPCEKMVKSARNRSLIADLIAC